jgi:hypothetical protein
MTCSTRRPNGSIPVLASQRPAEAGVVDVPGGQVGQRAAAPVFELDQRRPARPGRHRCVAARERLQLGLLVGADDVLVRMQPPTFKAPDVEIQHAAGLGLKVRVAREDPRALLPRFQRAVVQPAPDRRRRRVGDALLDHQPVQLSAREAPQRPLVPGRQFARDRDDLGDLLRGGNGAVDPTAACHAVQPDARRRTFVVGG